MPPVRRVSTLTLIATLAAGFQAHGQDAPQPTAPAQLALPAHSQSTSPVEAVTPVQPLAPALPLADPRRIEWREVVWGDRSGGMRHAAQPFLAGRLLEGEELYLAVGRPDLATAYRSKLAAQTGLRVAAALLLAGGAITAGVGESERDNGGGSGAAIAGGAMILGGALLVLAAMGEVSVVSDAELRRLVDTHNDSLRAIR